MLFLFWDNPLTISHQNFIEKVYQAANDCFLERTIRNIECRVSHPVIGRIPTALHKKASELREDEKDFVLSKNGILALRLNP
ncbi:DUF3871 family protein [Bacteroides faecis]|uniref:DUF3871 family protein n=1 Tax=Bacteroides faecis TaxID=674529 RepID=UPI00286E95BF|nr:DUF3871 family protein [Bacteroides faecis]